MRKQTLEERQLLSVTEPSLQGPLSLLKRKSAFFFSFLQFSQTQASEYSSQRFIKTSLLGLFVRNKNGDFMSTLSKELTFENGVMFALCRKGQIRQKWFLLT